MRIPNLFIVGAPKCGTTSLYAYLREHPRIYMSPVKEPQYFAADLRGNRRLVTSLEQYMSCFADATDEPVVGEASTAYLASPGAAGEILAFSPEARIIIMLRNPVDKMYSRYNDARFNNRESHETFEAALAAEARNGPSIGLGYRGSARYLGAVRRYFDTFERDRILVVLFDDFAVDTRQAYEDVLAFLGVPSDGRQEFPIVNNRQSARSAGLQDFVRRPPSLLRRTSHALLPRAARKGLRAWFSAMNIDRSRPSPIPQELRRRLLTELAPETEELGRLIGRDLSGWLNC